MDCISCGASSAEEASESIENVDEVKIVRPVRASMLGGPKASAVPPVLVSGGTGAAKVGKGVRRMPRLWKAMKDAASCDKPWVGASDP